MDLDLFQKELLDLCEKSGVILRTGIEVHMTGPAKQESLIGAFGDVSAMAEHSIAPISITFAIHTQTVSNWHHSSGDDRRLHPSLRPNVEVRGGPHEQQKE